MSKVKMYYDDDADLKYLAGKNVGIIGYGIQGRAQALNLRDSGVNVRIANREDSYSMTAKDDGFEVQKPATLSEWADIIMYLIPDDAQQEKYAQWVQPYLTTGKAICFAHGYAVYNKTINIPEDVDILLLAPRMPGKYIRERYLNGWGAPVFIDCYQNASGSGLNLVLALAKGIGATKIGAMKIKLAEETEIDLFIEQYLLPKITATIHKSFDFLVSKQFTPEAAISELYASSEIGELIALAAESNIYQVFRENASPTCQFGKMIGTEKLKTGDRMLTMEGVLEEIRSGHFNDILKKAGDNDYQQLQKYDQDIDQTLLVKTHGNYNKIHRGKKCSK